MDYETQYQKKESLNLTDPLSWKNEPLYLSNVHMIHQKLFGRKCPIIKGKVIFGECLTP